MNKLIETIYLEDTVHHVDHSIAGLIVNINDVGHGEDAGQGDLVGEGSDGDSLSSSSDQRCWSGRKVSGVKSSSSHVSQQH